MNHGQQGKENPRADPHRGGSLRPAGGGLAQVPGSDAAVITPIQVAMIVAIGAEHGTPIGKSAAAELVLPFSAAVVGRGLSQCLLGWVPGLGNAVNAITAAALTEAIGWAADAYFADGNVALDRPSQFRTEQWRPRAG